MSVIRIGYFILFVIFLGSIIDIDKWDQKIEIIVLEECFQFCITLYRCMSLFLYFIDILVWFKKVDSFIRILLLFSLHRLSFTQYNLKKKYRKRSVSASNRMHHLHLHNLRLRLASIITLPKFD